MMPSYRESITSEQAWDIVNYVRELQGNPPKQTATETPSTDETPSAEDTEQESAE